MRTFIPKALLAVLTCLSSFHCTAQMRWHERPLKYNRDHYYNAPKPWQTVHVSYGRHFSSAMINYSYKGRNYYGRMEAEQFSTTVTAHSSFGFGIGTFIPVCRLGEKSNLCFAFDGTLTMTNYNGINGEKGEGIFEENREEVLVGLDEIAIPFTLDYRIGCDAMRSKDYRTCFAIGFGGCYRNSAPIFYDIDSDNINIVSPVMKLEAGFHWGACYKLRLLYQFGKLNYMNYEEKTSEYEEKVSMVGKGNLVISLLIIPAALSWKSEGFK
jgi:hypothetical protein